MTNCFVEGLACLTNPLPSRLPTRSWGASTRWLTFRSRDAARRQAHHPSAVSFRRIGTLPRLLPR